MLLVVLSVFMCTVLGKGRRGGGEGGFDASASEVVIRNLRVQALSPTLVRVEHRGPLGYEDRNTFTIVNRSVWSGVPILSVERGIDVSIIKTAYYQVEVSMSQDDTRSCYGAQRYTEVVGAEYVPEYPFGVPDTTQSECCALCLNHTMCAAWEWQPHTGNCYIVASGLGRGASTRVSDKTMGWADHTGAVRILTADGSTVLYSVATLAEVSSMLNFPAPAEVGPVYALRDAPRFVPPKWGATPMPEGYAGPCKDTNGFDTRNDVPDAYFILTGVGNGNGNGFRGANAEEYSRLRRAVLELTGKIPRLPDYVFGTWFSWWHSYTQNEAMEEVARWRAHNISLDVFGLDIDWRNKSCPERYEVNTELFPNMQGYLAWAHNAGKVRTYFNDHPMSTVPQMTPTEVNYRYAGLTKMLDIGLDYWWYDSNWFHVIPGAFGLDNRIWPQYVFRSVQERWYAEHAPDTITHTLAMYTSNHPAHHRFPVWWTGDIMTQALEENLRITVDQGLQLKPYVHPDCGGFIGNTTDEVYARWIQFCSMSSIIRIHSSVLFRRQPWAYAPATEAIVKRYIDFRYALLPSLISAAHRAEEDGSPLAKRCDLAWPEFAPAAARSDQYLFLDSILVAPIIPFPRGNKSRSMWLPPGSWEHVWTGTLAAGPADTTVSAPVDYSPMFFRRGSVLVTAPPAQTADAQSWDKLFLELFPDSSSSSAETVVFTLYDTKSTGAGVKKSADPVVVDLLMNSPDDATVTLRIAPRQETFPAKAPLRTWAARVHAAPGSPMEKALPKAVYVDGAAAEARFVRPAESPDAPAIYFANPCIEVIVPPSKITESHTVVFKWN